MAIVGEMKGVIDSYSYGNNRAFWFTNALLLSIIPVIAIRARKPFIISTDDVITRLKV